MNHSKNENHSDTLSDENDHSSEKKHDEKTVTARSYECTFCKRGFTNAQALGGHMNIHRKDKAKAKAKAKANQKVENNSSFSTCKNHTNSSRYNFTPTYYDQQITNCQVALDTSTNKYHQFNVPILNPNYSYPGYGYYQTTLPDYHVANTENIFRLHEENLGVSLSLDVGLSNMEDGKMKKRIAREDREHKVDLELRLGYDP